MTFLSNYVHTYPKKKKRTQKTTKPILICHQRPVTRSQGQDISISSMLLLKAEKIRSGGLTLICSVPELAPEHHAPPHIPKRQDEKEYTSKSEEKKDDRNEHVF